MTRAPIFRVADVAEAEALVSWVRDNEGVLREAAESTTSHGELLDVTPYVVGNNVYLRFRYDTKDAMGMNMVTIATREACDEIEAETDASLVALGEPLFGQEAGRDQRGRGARTLRGRRRGGSPRGRRGAAPHDAGVDRGDQHPEEPRRLREGGRARLQRPRRQRGRGDVPRDRAGRGPGRRGGERDHDRGRRRPRATCTSPCRSRAREVGTVGGGTGLPTQAAGLDILGVRGGGDPAGSNGDALAEAIAGARSPASFAARGARLQTPLPPRARTSGGRRRFFSRFRAQSSAPDDSPSDAPDAPDLPDPPDDESESIGVPSARGPSRGP